MLSTLLLLLSSCDGSTPEEREARRIAKCQEMITTTRPMPTAHLPLTERGKEIDFNGKWERCRAMVEDDWLPNEQRENGWLNGKQYHYIKLGNQVIKGPSNYLKVGDAAFTIEYTWKHSYIEYDIMTRKYYVAPPEARNGVYFGMHSVNNLAYQHAVSRAPNYDVACDNIENKAVSDVKATFIWNGILFGALTRIEHKGDNQIKWQEEWQRICPIAIEAVVSQLEIVATQPTTIVEE